MIGLFRRLALLAAPLLLLASPSAAALLSDPLIAEWDSSRLLAAVLPPRAMPGESLLPKAFTEVATTPQCTQYGPYPWIQNGCINSPDLNKAIEGSWSTLPPRNNQNQGAGQGKYWTDTSTGLNTPTLRQCIKAPGCSYVYNAAEWQTWGQYNLTNHTFAFAGGISGGGGGIGGVIAPITFNGVLIGLSMDNNFFVNGSNQLALKPIAAGHLIANSTASSAEPVDTTLTALLDRAFGSTSGTFLQRGVSNWLAGPLVTSGTNNGVMFLNGSGLITTTNALPYRDLVTSLSSVPQLQFHMANVKSGGAVGNGSTNDHDALQATIDYVRDTFGSGYVFFPPGNYRVAPALNVWPGIILAGSGATVVGGGTQIQSIGDNVVLNFPDSVNGGDWSGFKDIWVLGKQSLPSTSSAVVVGKNALVHMQDCQVWGAGTALFDKGTDGIRLNCAFMGLTNGMQTQGANWYIRVKFDEAYASNVTSVYIGDSISGFPQENHFIQCDFSGNHLTNSLVINDATHTSLSAFSQSVFSSPIQLSNGYWAGFSDNEFGSATFFINSNHPFVTFTGNRSLLPVTITGFLNGLSAAANSNITPEFNFTVPLGPIKFGDSATFMTGLINSPGSQYVCVDDVTGQLTRFTDCFPPGGGRPVLHVGSIVSDSFNFTGVANEFSGGVTFSTANIFMTALTATPGNAYVCVGPGAGFQLSKSTTFCGSNPGYINAVNPTNGISASITGSTLNISWGGGTVTGTTNFTGAITISNNFFLPTLTHTAADTYACVASGSSFQVTYNDHCGTATPVTQTGGTVAAFLNFTGNIDMQGNLFVTGAPHTAADAYLCVASGSSFQVAYNASCGPSDAKKKDLVAVLSRAKAARLIDGVAPWEYTLKDDPSKKLHYGLLAQEVEDIDSTCVTYNDDGEVTSTDDRCLIAVLWTEVRNLRREVATRH